MFNIHVDTIEKMYIFYPLAMTLICTVSAFQK